MKAHDMPTDTLEIGNMRILVIDDDPDSRDLLQRAFEADGFVVVTAASGEEGLDLARRLRPGFITLDVMMPGMDGWAVLRQLKDDPELEHIPVVMISIVAEEAMGYALGAHAYLGKPIDRDRLIARIHEIGMAEGARILVVDDDGDTRDLVRRALLKRGFEVDEAENGAEALRRLE